MIKDMTADIARRAADAANAKAQELGTTISVAVCDEAGNLVFFSRGDTCTFANFETSRGKAAMAAGFRRPTKDYKSFVAQNMETAALWMTISNQLGMVVAGGGYPITKNNVVIGGIGCGGAPGDVDHLCSEAGAKAVSS
jgi:uncharacterized protein GlcG (DUF336 family)